MQYQRILYFLFLIVACNACMDKNALVQGNQETPIKESESSIEHSTNNDLRLKFTTGVRSILEDSKGNFWFGSHQEGVCLFDGKQLTYFTTEDGLSDMQIRSIFEDSSGKIWFEGGKGISSYDGKKISIYPKKNYHSKSDWKSSKDDLWFKGEEINNYNTQEVLPGVYRYDGNDLNYHVFPLVLKKDRNSGYSVSTPFVRGRNGRLWFATYSAVIGYDNTLLPMQQAGFTILDDSSLGLTEETGYLHVRSIFEDSKGNLWIGNNGIGVWLYDGNTTINFSKLHGLISANSLMQGGYRSPSGSLEHVFSIGEDDNGIMWFGDRDTGAWRYDGKTWNNYTMKDGLTTTHIWQIYKDKRGELWFAMGDGSVCKFNGISFDRIF